MKYYLAIKKKEILLLQPHGWTLQGIMLREISQRKTNTISFHLESSEQIHRYREQTDSCQRGGSLEGWVKTVKELRRRNGELLTATDVRTAAWGTWATTRQQGVGPGGCLGL